MFSYKHVAAPFNFFLPIITTVGFGPQASNSREGHITVFTLFGVCTGVCWHAVECCRLVVFYSCPYLDLQQSMKKNKWSGKWHNVSSVVSSSPFSCSSPPFICQVIGFISALALTENRFWGQEQVLFVHNSALKKCGNCIVRCGNREASVKEVCK